MRYLARVVRTVSGSKVALGVCGEMGGRPLEAMALLGVGIERLSITPAGVGPVKAMIRSLDLGALRADMPAILAQRSEEHTSELPSLMRISYAVFCLKKKTT